MASSLHSAAAKTGTESNPERFPIIMPPIASKSAGTPQKEQTALSIEPRTLSHPAFRFIDLFAGIGGMRRGFETLGGKCVFTSEWNKYAQRTYQANYDCDHEIAGDITQVPADEIPPHDLLLAGFPCQPFSIAGVSKKNALKQPHGFRCEAQGTLFFDVARIIEAHRPHAFFLENVKNLVNHDKGRTFRVIHRALTDELAKPLAKTVGVRFSTKPIAYSASTF